MENLVVFSHIPVELNKRIFSLHCSLFWLWTYILSWELSSLLDRGCFSSYHVPRHCSPISLLSFADDTIIFPLARSRVSPHLCNFCTSTSAPRDSLSIQQKVHFIFPQRAWISKQVWYIESLDFNEGISQSLVLAAQSSRGGRKWYIFSQWSTKFAPNSMAGNQSFSPLVGDTSLKTCACCHSYVPASFYGSS